MRNTRNGWRMAGLSSLATAALVGGILTTGGAASADSDFTFDRIAGQDRYATSTLVADEYRNGDQADVILANGGATGSYADALSANYLSGNKDAPILLTQQDETPQSVLDQLEDMNAQSITLMGGAAAISDEQEQALTDEGYTVNRVAGDDRFDTNADTIDAGGDAQGDLGLIATGFDFPDALAGGAISYTGRPLGLSTQDDIDDDVVQALKDSGVERVLILGGEAAVGSEVADELENKDITVEKRFSGDDRADTSAMAARYAVNNLGFTDEGVNVASGYPDGDGADALAGGALTGKQQRPLLVTKNVDKPGQAVLDYLEDNANTLSDGIIFGGEAAVSDGAEQEMQQAARSVTTNQDFQVSPSDPATKTVSDGENSERSYTVSGLDDTRQYNIALFPAENVDTSSAQVTFADGDTDDVADFSPTEATVSSVNNGSVSDNNGLVVDAQPVNGVVKFTITDEDGADKVTPVVYRDADSGADDGNDVADLDLNADDTPSEAFGVGGTTTYVSGEAQTGQRDADQLIDSVNKDANSLSTSGDAPDGDGPGARYDYDSNDTYFVVDGAQGDEDAPAPGPGDRVTMAQFEEVLSVGDQLDDDTFYQSNPDLPSSFVLENVSPMAPGQLSADDTTDTSTTLTVLGVDDSADQVTIYGEQDDGSDPTVTKDSDVYATANQDADSDTSGFQVDVTDLSPDTTYDFAASQSIGNEESGLSPELENLTTATTGSTVAPTIDDAVLTTDMFTIGEADDGDIGTLTFSENVRVGDPATDGPQPEEVTATATDPDGDLFKVVCYQDPTQADTTAGDGDTAAQCQLGDSDGVDDDENSNTGDQVTITLLEDAEDRNVAGDDQVTYPVTLTSVTNVEDVDDNAVDLDNSADTVIDSE